jgi:hypothetical protein
MQREIPQGGRILPGSSTRKEAPMRRSIAMCGLVVLCVAVAACTTAPPPRVETGGPATPEPEAAPPEAPEEQAEAPEMTPGLGIPVPPGARHENLTCFTGTEDRQARIGVELINDQVAYFAFYSKWRPRTCSLDAGRGDAFSQWADADNYSTVTLADHNGELRIERESGGAYRFGFVDVDRTRYCGMPGKINGSLTVTRGKDSCVVEGIMDGHAM